MPTERRWPLEPLLEAVGGRRAVVFECRVSGATVEHWAEHGLSDRQADRSACRAGVHPSAIWPGWIDAVPLLDIIFVEMRQQVWC